MEVKRQKFNIKFYYYDPPCQRNGKLERKFQTNYGTIGGMLNDSGVECGFCKWFWDECTSTAIYFENNKGNKSRH
jgi:hypothetical protein